MAAKYDLEIDSGATYTVQFVWRNSSGALVNLTGYSAALKIRPNVESTTTSLSLTSGAGITLGGAAGTVDVTISAAQTTTLASGNFVYDLKLTSGGGIATRLTEGDVVVNAEVSRV